MSHRRFLTSAAVFIIASSATWACGPNFPWQLLTDRENTLKETPSNSFAFEARHLVSPTDGLKPMPDRPEDYRPSDIDAREHARETATGYGLTADQHAYTEDISTTDTGDAVYRRGAGQPEYLRLYTAGAADFLPGRWSLAERWFQRVLALPTETAKPRNVWAAYSLGRALAKDGKADAAKTAFEQARTLSRAGGSDAEFLGVDSYGEEARLFFNRAKTLVRNKSLSDAEAFRQNIAAAVALYAQQAADNDPGAIDSLRMVAEDLITSDAKIAASAADPLTLRLLVIYKLAGFTPPEWDGVGPAPAHSRYDAAYYRSFRHLVEAVAQQKQPLPGDDRLAVFAYQNGETDIAAILAKRSHTPLAYWVLAKIAVMRGDAPAAAANYALAIRAADAKAGEGSLQDSAHRRLQGESAVLAMSRQDYLQALEQLYPLGSAYWSDIAYIGERVLTTDELKQFIDTRAPKLDAAPVKPWTVAPMIGDTDQWGWEEVPVRLRDLLARRLVRDGRYRDALAYFHKADDKILHDPQVRDHLEAYIHALDRAHHAWSPLTRAQGWYDASALTRAWGMEMMGYEGTPDYLGVDGEYGDDDVSPGYAILGQVKLGKAYTSRDERLRFNASAAAPDKRYHYRAIAIDEARRAAALLPPRSQAYAAVLCTAYSYNPHRDEATAQQIYQQYVKTGAHVAFAKHFGQDCPDPNFDDAARINRLELYWSVKHFAGKHRWSFGGGGVVLAAAAAYAIRRRRKRLAHP